MRTDGQTGRQMDGPADRYVETNRLFCSFLRKCLRRKEQCITDVKEEKHTQGTEEIVWDVQMCEAKRSNSSLCGVTQAALHQQPDNRYSVSSRRTIFFKGCTTFANVSISVNSSTIVLFSNGKIPDIIIGVDPAVDILNAIMRACCSSSEQLWDSALLRQFFYWANSQNVRSIETKQGFPCLTFVLVTK